jgi:hypothetical protein
VGHAAAARAPSAPPCGRIDGRGADVIWPAAILSERLLAWWVIGVSLVIEFFFVRSAFRLPTAQVAWMTFAVNASIAAIGPFVVPFLGLMALHVTGIGLRLHWEDFGPAD